jgi:hypothetical protein
MSFYRPFDRYPRADVHASPGAAEGVALSHARRTFAINVESDQYAHLRKATPIERPLLRTTMWFAGLPEDVRPHALLRRYARIANLIAAAWADAKCFRAYMASLFTDTRGSRRGFPPDVLADLVALSRYYESSVAAVK